MEPFYNPPSRATIAAIDTPALLVDYDKALGAGFLRLFVRKRWLNQREKA